MSWRSDARRWSRGRVPPWARSWATDSALLLASQGLTVAATSVAAILIARHLHPGDWGVFAGFLGLSLSLAILVEFGLSTWLLRELSPLFASADRRAFRSAARLMSAALAVCGSVAGAIVAASVIVSELRGSRAGVTVALALLLIYGGLFASSNVLEAHLRARRRVKRVVAGSVLEKYVLLALVVVAWISGFGIVGIGLAYVVAGCLRFAYLGWSVFAFQGAGVPMPRRADIRAVVRSSFPFALTAGSLNFVPKLDTFVLLAFSATSAGYFAVGDRALGPALIVPATLGTALYPFMAPRSRTTSAVWKLAGLFTLLGGIFALAGAVAAPALVPLLFGGQYRDAVPTVQVMLISMPLVYASTPLLVYAYTNHRERTIVRATVGISLLGTAGIAVGQSVDGVTLAAGGYVLRQLLFVGALIFVAARTRSVSERVTEEEAEPANRPSPSVEVVR
jgi:O-antigen/teichoic acid export membrane protein